MPRGARAVLCNRYDGYLWRYREGHRWSHLWRLFTRHHRRPSVRVEHSERHEPRGNGAAALCGDHHVLAATSLAGGPWQEGGYHRLGRVGGHGRQTVPRHGCDDGFVHNVRLKGRGWEKAGRRYCDFVQISGRNGETRGEF